MKPEKAELYWDQPVWHVRDGTVIRSTRIEYLKHAIEHAKPEEPTPFALLNRMIRRFSKKTEYELRQCYVSWFAESEACQERIEMAQGYWGEIDDAIARPYYPVCLTKTLKEHGMNKLPSGRACDGKPSRKRIRKQAWMRAYCMGREVQLLKTNPTLF